MTDGAKLTFFGGAGTVTGSKYLVEAFGRRVLVDCGLFQGTKELRLRNWAEPPFNPQSIDAVVLTHAHLDHSGYLPLLTKRGFTGPVHCTSGTADLIQVVLRDSAKLQEEDARRANKYGYSKHHPALPLYTLADAEQCLSQVQRSGYHDAVHITDEITANFRRAGHILGSATVELRLGDSRPLRVVFSGDLGRWDRPILRDPELVSAADVLLVESTYGDREHLSGTNDALARVITETAHRGGAVVVPAFAIGRTQELIWRIRELEEAGKLPLVAVYIDSPMATNVTDFYCRHPEDHDMDMQQLMDEKRCPLCCREYHLVRSVEESKALNSRQGPMVIIAGSGMATGGRVLHHLKRRLPDYRNTVLLTGYQAVGTRGRALQEGAREIRIHGAMVPVRAHVETIHGLSAHADRNELLRWLRGFEEPPKQTYVVHGEPEPARSLADSIQRELRWQVAVAVDGATVEF